MLRSVNDLHGYTINASDGDVGTVKDVYFDDKAWDIRCLVVDPTNWWPGGRRALVATRWISGINWPQRAVTAKVTRDAIRNSPEYDSKAPITRDYEARLHEFYGRPVRPQTSADSAAPVHAPAP